MREAVPRPSVTVVVSIICKKEFVVNDSTSHRSVLHLGSARGEPSTKALRDVIELGGRVLMAALFLLSGVGKIAGYAATVAYMKAAGVPGVFLPLVIALEVGGGVALVVGWQTRATAFLLAGFTLLSALLFHNDFGDQIQTVMFLKNVSIAGGLLMLVANGAGRLSVDRGPR